MPARWHKGVSLGSVFTNNVSPSPNWRLKASVPKVQYTFTHYGDTTNLLLTCGTSLLSMSYCGVISEDAATVFFRPLLWFNCPYKASLMIPLRKLLVDDVVTIPWGLPGGTPRLKRRRRIKTLVRWHVPPHKKNDCTTFQRPQMWYELEMKLLKYHRRTVRSFTCYAYFFSRGPIATLTATEDIGTNLSAARLVRMFARTRTFLKLRKEYVRQWVLIAADKAEISALAQYGA